MVAPETKAVLERAVRAAIDIETRVRDVYAEAVAAASDPVGRKVFQILADEEQGHLDYLERRLALLGETGELVPGEIVTAVPSRNEIEAGVSKLRGKLDRGGADEAEVALLRRALAVEQETSELYRRMVRELPAEGQAFFRGFVAIEEGHVAVVQAEIDSVTGMGFWFDFQEFDLEAG